MIENKYFDDAFILHEETKNILKLKKYLKKSQRKDFNDSKAEGLLLKMKMLLDSKTNDVRQNLYLKWAKFSNMFKFQPMWEIRNYFGESNAIYFAWQGVFISTLWVPMVIGIAFFLASLINKYFTEFFFALLISLLFYFSIRKIEFNNNSTNQSFSSKYFFYRINKL